MINDNLIEDLQLKSKYTRELKKIIEIKKRLESMKGNEKILEDVLQKIENRKKALKKIRQYTYAEIYR